MNGSDDLQYALINLDHHIHHKDFDDLFLTGLFNMLKMQLMSLGVADSSLAKHLFCSSFVEVDESRWVQLANILQHSLTIIDLHQIMTNFVICLVSEKGKQKVLNKIKTRTVVPDQDPISSYALFQTWQDYYIKIFKN